MDLGLAGGRWLVTGGTSGLGLATARRIHAEGGRLILVGRDERRGRAAAAELDAALVVGDLADDTLPDRILATAASLDEPLAGAVLSVGGPPAGTVTQVGDDQWRASFDSVFLGPVRLSRVLAERSLTCRSLVWVLSSSARSPIAGLSVSNGLRPGLAMLVKDLADELGPRGIRVNALAPGRFDTARVAELEAGSPDPAALRAEMAARIPLRRYGDPAEFGSVAAFLLSPAASYVTGSLVAVDGGATRAL